MAEYIKVDSENMAVREPVDTVVNVKAMVNELAAITEQIKPLQDRADKLTVLISEAKKLGI